MQVRERLRRAPVTAPPTCSCQEAAQIMASYDVGSLLVVDAGRLVGIVTDRDLVVRAFSAGMGSATSLADVMTASPVSVQGGSDISVAADVMASAGVRRVPVLEGTEVAGVVSLDDVLRDGLSGYNLVVT